MITALTVNYNTPDYLERLLSSFRKYYDIPYIVIDGSDEQHFEKIREFPEKYDVRIIHFKYNIHHGPGMEYGITQCCKTGQILIMDSDMIIHNGGWLTDMYNQLKPESYGIGDVQKEFYMEGKVKVWVPYLHPAFCLVNKKVVRQYPMPIKGGAPMIAAMKEIWLQKKSDKLLQRLDWLKDDLYKHKKQYVQHNENHEGMGTVARTGGYHLD
jgi:hypothetical protein